MLEILGFIFIIVFTLSLFNYAIALFAYRRITKSIFEFRNREERRKGSRF